MLDDPSIFHRCVDDSNDTVMITDPRGVLQYVNKSWLRVYGYTREEAIGKTPALVKSEHQDEPFYRAMWSQIANPQIGYWKGELINRAKDGREVPVFLSITPFHSEDGALLGYMGIAVDISEKRALEAKLLHQDRLASLGVISAGLAHEIGNPLGVIRGRAEFLSYLMRENAVAKQNLEIMVSQIDRIARLMYGLLHLARGTRSEALRPIEVRPILDRVLELLSPQIQNNSISVDNSVPSEAVVLAESNLMEQVALNLMLNAVQAIEAAREQGRTADHQLTLSAARVNGSWTFSLSDTGCGIPEEHQNEIMKPFFTTKAPEVGTGLGLPICDQILRGWQGSLSFVSQVGKGTTLTFTVPTP